MTNQLSKSSLITKVVDGCIMKVTTIILNIVMVGISIEIVMFWVWSGVLNTNGWEVNKNKHEAIAMRV